MADRNMQGKRAIVTGGGTGLGAATAVGLAERSANICINYNSSADAADQVVAECVKHGRGSDRRPGQHRRGCRLPEAGGYRRRRNSAASMYW